MDIKKFGNFLLLAGFILLGVAGYFLYSVNSGTFMQKEAAAAAGRAWGIPDRNDVAGTKERAESKSLIFGAAGGLLILIGLGVSLSSKDGAAESKKCPFCAEWVKADATICRFCQKELPASLTATVP